MKSRIFSWNDVNILRILWERCINDVTICLLMKGLLIYIYKHESWKVFSHDRVLTVKGLLTYNEPMLRSYSNDKKRGYYPCSRIEWQEVMITHVTWWKYKRRIPIFHLRSKINMDKNYSWSLIWQVG